MTSIHFSNKSDTLLNWITSTKEVQEDISKNKICIFYHQSDFNHSVINELANLAYHFENLLIYDWGYISFKDLDQLKEILNKLESDGYVSIFIGASSSEAHSMWKNNSGNLYLGNRLNQIFTDEDPINIDYIGYQRHFSDLRSIRNVENNSLNAISLGRTRSLNNQIEPILRDTKKAYIDLNILKSSELPGNPDTCPAGLSAEELCQIIRYIGEANNISTIIINTNLSSQSARNTTEVKMMALSIWYLLEGLNLRQSDHPTQSKNHQSFIVDLGSDMDVTFKKHISSNRWWLEMDDKIIAVSQQEYEDCVNGNIPLRISKLI